MGRQIAVVGALATLADGTVARHRTETVYDSWGRVETRRSNIRHDLTGAGNHDDSQVQETRYQYDARGNAIKTIFDNGSYQQVRFDSQNRKVAEAQQVSSDVVSSGPRLTVPS